MLERIQYIDDIVINWVGKLHSPIRNKIMVAITTLGNKGIVWFAFCLPFLIVKPWRITGANILVALAIAHLAGEIIIKHIVCRIRPCHKLDEDQLIIKKPKYYSFPSGHTTASFAVVAVTALRCPWYVWAPVLVVAGLIGFSRVYLRVHYLTDVLVGAVLGLICGILAVQIFNAMF